MTWHTLKQQFSTYLYLECSLSQATVTAYLQDMSALEKFLHHHYTSMAPTEVKKEHLNKFFILLHEQQISTNSRARMWSSIKSFYNFLWLESFIKQDPTLLLERPKTTRKLPNTLEIHEVEKLLNAIDTTTWLGVRNRAIVETMYGTGLRVSELTALKFSQLYLEECFLRIIGKGNKERLMPLGALAVKWIKYYVQTFRSRIPIAYEHTNYVFLSRRGKQLGRHMIFTIIKKLGYQIGLKQAIHPHTLRHAFATHLIEGGADLRAVQEMLGHASITTTEIYTHMDRQYLAQTIQDYHPRS